MKKKNSDTVIGFPGSGEDKIPSIDDIDVTKGVTIPVIQWYKHLLAAVKKMPDLDHNEPWNLESETKNWPIIYVSSGYQAHVGEMWRQVYRKTCRFGVAD